MSTVDNCKARQYVFDEDAKPKTETFPILWNECENVYQCRIAIVEEKVGGYSVVAVDLPGVVSQGETEEEAVISITEAIKETIAIYLTDDDFKEIPWSGTPVDVPHGAKELRILVHV